MRDRIIELCKKCGGGFCTLLNPFLGGLVGYQDSGVGGGDE